MEQANNITIWKMLKFEAKLCFGNSPVLMTAEAIASVIHGLSIVSITIGTQWFFDLTMKSVQQRAYAQIFYGAVIFGLIIVSNQVINGVENYLWDVTYKKLKGFSYKRFFQKAVDFDAEVFESPDFMDNLYKAKEGGAHFNQPLFPCIGLSTFYLAYFLGMALYMAHLQPVLVVSIVLVFVPTVFGQYFKTFLFSRLADEAAPHRRRYEYYENCIGHKDFLRETRTLCATPFFLKKYLDELQTLTVKIWRTNKKAALYSLAAQLMTLGGYLGILCLLTSQLLKGNISAGAFGAIFASVGTIFSMMGEVMETVNELVENIGLMKNYIRFLERPLPQLPDRPVTVREGIHMEEASYRYNNAEKDAFTDVNLHIRAGETVAIVGDNGSGKTTLIKVMAGLYQPTKGCVYYDHTKISEVAPHCVREQMSVVCQNYVRYKMSLRDNISISRGVINRPDDGMDDEIIGLLEAVGLWREKEQFQLGLDTMLGREFGGIELSGGQWQRLAIARGMYRDNILIFLDEPTAAVDPIEESGLFELLKDAGRGKVSLIVTHRLGCARIADRIIVMEKGRIVETGTHDELLAAGQKYSKMYHEQAKWYIW
ncbi:MAG TPA: ABC transporter ATP-binding protein [Clostridia bacterium]|nr:ABC transporter ATP-binding protein [Clostridia bacterium]